MSADWAAIVSVAVAKVDEGALNVLTESQLALDFDANRGEINDAIGALAPADPRIDAVRALHQKETRYLIQGYDDRSFGSEQEAREWDDEGWQTGKPLETFDVCAECARVEWDSVDQQTDGEGAMGITSMWPCRTAIALDGAQ